MRACADKAFRGAVPAGPKAAVAYAAARRANSVWAELPEVLCSVS